MISASEVYWVMQADTLISILIPIAFITALSGATVIICSILGVDGVPQEAFRKQTGWNLLLVSLTCALLIAFIPNSKTLAAMVLLPTITSDKVIDTISPEAKELYGLTKDALKNLSHPTKECKNKEE